MATADQFIAQAAKYIGVSGTNNIFNRWYWGHDCYDPNVYPWCAAFQSYVGVHDLKMPFKPSASASGVAMQGTRVKDEDARKGDWVLFNWDGRQDFSWANHIGVVEWSDINGSGYFGTIEGNTGSGEGSVMRQTRYNWGSYATAFFRPPYSESEDDMRPADVWEYNWNKTAPEGNMYNCVVSMYYQVAALSEAVKELAKSQGVDPEKIAASVDKAVKERLEKIKLEVSAS